MYIIYLLINSKWIFYRVGKDPIERREDEKMGNF